MTIMLDCKIGDCAKCPRFYYSSSETDPGNGRRRLKECACECHRNLKQPDAKDENKVTDINPKG